MFTLWRLSAHFNIIFRYINNFDVNTVGFFVSNIPFCSYAINWLLFSRKESSMNKKRYSFLRINGTFVVTKAD